MAMWDLYGRGSGIVAVKSTVERLKLAATESRFRTFLGRVKYLDWNVAPWDNNALTMCFRKDLSYQHEAEFRAVIWDSAVTSQNMSDALAIARSRSDYPTTDVDPFLLRREDGRRGIEIPFATDRFITEVVVGPREQMWVAELVNNVLQRYGLDVNVSISDRLRPRPAMQHLSS